MRGQRVSQMKEVLFSKQESEEPGPEVEKVMTIKKDRDELWALSEIKAQEYAKNYVNENMRNEVEVAFSEGYEKALLDFYFRVTEMIEGILE